MLRLVVNGRKREERIQGRWICGRVTLVNLRGGEGRYNGRSMLSIKGSSKRRDGFAAANNCSRAVAFSC